MYELTVLICSRGLRMPDPGAAFDRENGILPMLSTNDSIGSLGNGRLSTSPASSRWPMSWSMNWPHTAPQRLTPRWEKMFWLPSLKMRLLIIRLSGPGIMAPMPSS